MSWGYEDDGGGDARDYRGSYCGLLGELQGGTGERTLVLLWEGPRTDRGTIAPPSSWILVFGGSRIKRSWAMLEGAGSMRHLGDVSGDAADAGGRRLDVSKAGFLA